MSWQRELVAAAREEAAGDARVVELRVFGSLADGEAELDDWSDVDLAVQSCSGDLGDWPGRFGRPWALTRQQDGDLLVQRTVYRYGRRMDLVTAADRSSLPAGRVLHRATGPDVPAGAQPVEPTEALMEVRFAAALAVVKFARADLLIGFHLALDLVRGCLVQAMQLRDRDTGTTSHRVGGPRNDVVARLEVLRAHPWTATGGIALVEEVVRVHDDLARELDPTYRADWSGLEALVLRARAA